MNLPPDKARLLRQYDNEKKWELVCDQVSVTGVLGVPSGPSALSGSKVGLGPACGEQWRVDAV